MYTTYHFNSAEEVNQDIIDSIRATYKSKPINITIIEEEKIGYQLSNEQKTILEERLKEDTTKYISGEDSLEKIRLRYDI